MRKYNLHFYELNILENEKKIEQLFDHLRKYKNEPINIKKLISFDKN